jgi:hypothetical protein
VRHGQFRLDRAEKNLCPPEIEPRFSGCSARTPVGILGKSFGCEKQIYFTLWEISIEFGKPIICPTWDDFVTLIGASITQLTNSKELNHS